MFFQDNSLNRIMLIITLLENKVNNKKSFMLKLDIITTLFQTKQLQRSNKRTKVEFFILFISLGFIYLFFKPAKKTKSKKQKQAEIFELYEKQMRAELDGLSGENLKNRKMMVLKKIADELNRNLFFDKDETKTVIQRLIHGK